MSSAESVRDRDFTSFVLHTTTPHPVTGYPLGLTSARNRSCFGSNPLLSSISAAKTWARTHRHQSRRSACSHAADRDDRNAHTQQGRGWLVRNHTPRSASRMSRSSTPQTPFLRPSSPSAVLDEGRTATTVLERVELVPERERDQTVEDSRRSLIPRSPGHSSPANA